MVRKRSDHSPVEQRVTRVLPDRPARVIEVAKNRDMLVLQDDGAWGVTVFAASSVPPRVLPPETQGPGVAYGLAVLRRLGPNSLRELYAQVADGHVVSLPAELWARLQNSVATQAGAWGFADGHPQRQRQQRTASTDLPQRHRRVVLAGLPFPERADAVWQAFEPGRLLPDFHFDAVHGTAQSCAALDQPLYYGLRAVPIGEWLDYLADRMPCIRQPLAVTIDAVAVQQLRIAAALPEPTESGPGQPPPASTALSNTATPKRRGRVPENTARIQAFLKRHKFQLPLNSEQRALLRCEEVPDQANGGTKASRTRTLMRCLGGLEQARPTG
jgi:hypothetical protein